MAWELVKGYDSRGIKIGQFAVRSSPNFHAPYFEGKTYNWYVDKAKRVAKLVVEKNALRSAKKTITIPKAVCQIIEQEQTYIIFLDEDAMYFGRYKDGQEHLQKFIKAGNK